MNMHEYACIGMHTKHTHSHTYMRAWCDKPCRNGSEAKRDFFIYNKVYAAFLVFSSFHITFLVSLLLRLLLLSQQLLLLLQLPLLLLLLPWSWSVMASVLLSLLWLALLVSWLAAWLATTTTTMQKPRLKRRRNCVVAAAAFSACPAQAKSSKSGFVRKLHCLRHQATRRAQQDVGGGARERERAGVARLEIGGTM